MTDDKQKIIDKIKKLLALATSDSIGEAAAAAAKAQELMEKHAIEEAMLRDQEPNNTSTPDITSVVLWRGGKVPSWMLQLACGIGEVNRCKVWFRSGRPSKGFDSLVVHRSGHAAEQMAGLVELGRDTGGAVGQLHLPGLDRRHAVFADALAACRT